MTTYEGNMQGECRGQERRGWQGVTPAVYNQLVSSVGPDLTIPIPSGAGQHGGGQQRGSHNYPALFGQNQLEDGLGPIYAIPTFPWQPGPGQGQVLGSAQAPGHSPWQQGDSHSQQDDDLGPVYATPSFPWQPVGGQGQLGHGQNMRSGHWHQWGIHPYAAMPCCPCHQYRYY